MTSILAPIRTRRPPGLLLAILASCAGMAAVPASAGAVTVGIGDQLPGMFSSPLFTGLHIRNARLTVPWNVATARSERGALKAARVWLADAKDDGVTPLISFSRDGNSPHVPTVGQYTKAVKAFIHDFRYIKLYTAWNEPDWVYIRFGRNPKLAAQYYNALVKTCRRCTVAAGDLYVGAPSLKKYLRTYIRYLRYRPKAWALHPYYDVRAHKTSQIRAFESMTRGPIWLDEISGVEFRGHWPFPKSQPAAAASRDEKYLFSLPRKFHRISRIYHYMWQASTAPYGTVWDSALLDPSGNPRPAYYVVKKAVH